MMLARRWNLACLSILICSFAQLLGVPTSFSRNDPFPVYTSLDPYTFLYKKERFIDKDGIERQRYVPQSFYLSLSPFGQNADVARDNFKEFIPLGDIKGRWNMLALLYGCTPACDMLPPALLEAQQELFPTITPPICDQPTDPCQRFGFFSVDSKYRKRGFRWDLNLHICGDVGLNIQGGVSDICNTSSCFCNLTDFSGFTDDSGDDPNLFDPCNPNLTPANVDKFLMDRLKIIADQLCLDICSFHLTTVEDLRFNLYWRHAYEGNMILDDWPDLYVMPFLMLSGVVAIGKERDTSQIFSLSHGNNDHHALSGTAGVNLDFVETVELGCELGGTYFFPRDFNCFRVPNNICQQTLFPFVTDIRRSPGWNWHFAAKLGAYHFLEHLSFYFQYVVVQHQDDKICLKVCDPCFEPQALEKISTFKTQLANIAFNYDISPHISIGFLWQAPLMQLFSYRSTTVLFSLNAFY